MSQVPELNQLKQWAMSPEAQGAGIGFMAGILADAVIFSVRSNDVNAVPTHTAHLPYVPHYLANHAAHLNSTVKTYHSSLTDLQYAEGSQLPAHANKQIHEAESTLERALRHDQGQLKAVRRREKAYITARQPRPQVHAGSRAASHGHSPAAVHVGELYGGPLAIGTVLGAFAVAGWRRLTTGRKNKIERQRTHEEIIQSFKATMDIDLGRLGRKK